MDSVEKKQRQQRVSYTNGVIYKLECLTTGLYYIGSTADTTANRLKRHMKEDNRCSSKRIIEGDNYVLTVLERYPCNNKKELEKREGEIQKQELVKEGSKCVNIMIAGGRYESKAEHDRIYSKKYYQQNKGKILDYHKQYKQQNKDKISEQKKEYYQQNKDKLGAKVQCQCGASVNKSSIARHRKTKKHLLWQHSVSLSSVDESSEKSNDSEHQFITQDFVYSEEKKEELDHSDLKAN